MGIFFFLVINIFRHSILLVLNWKVYDIFVIYNHALESFSDYVIITLPCIIILAIYSIISNIVFIPEKYSWHGPVHPGCVFRDNGGSYQAMGKTLAYKNS